MFSNNNNINNNINNRKLYKHSISNIESFDSLDSSSMDINNPNKKLYKEDMYLFGGVLNSGEIRKR